MESYYYLLIAVLVLIVDRTSKVMAGIGFRQGHPLFFRDGFFSLRYVENSGGAFGLFPRKGFLFIVVTAAAVGLIIYLLFFTKLAGPLTKWGLALLLGGSSGNLVDRVVAGAVVDFIRVDGFPIFNLADVAIVTGSGLLIFVLAGGSKLIGHG